MKSEIFLAVYWLGENQKDTKERREKAGGYFRIIAHHLYSDPQGVCVSESAELSAFIRDWSYRSNAAVSPEEHRSSRPLAGSQAHDQWGV